MRENTTLAPFMVDTESSTLPFKDRHNKSLGDISESTCADATEEDDKIQSRIGHSGSETSSNTDREARIIKSYSCKNSKETNFQLILFCIYT